jgi:hypothetical protein
MEHLLTKTLSLMTLAVHYLEDSLSGLKPQNAHPATNPNSKRAIGGPINSTGHNAPPNRLLSVRDRLSATGTLKASCR